MRKDDPDSKLGFDITMDGQTMSVAQKREANMVQFEEEAGDLKTMQ